MKNIESINILSENSPIKENKSNFTKFNEEEAEKVREKIKNVHTQ